MGGINPPRAKPASKKPQIYLNDRQQHKQTKHLSIASKMHHHLSLYNTANKKDVLGKNDKFYKTKNIVVAVELINHKKSQRLLRQQPCDKSNQLPISMTMMIGTRIFHPFSTIYNLQTQHFPRFVPPYSHVANLLHCNCRWNNCVTCLRLSKTTKRTDIIPVLLTRFFI